MGHGEYAVRPNSVGQTAVLLETTLTFMPELVSALRHAHRVELGGVIFDLVCHCLRFMKPE